MAKRLIVANWKANPRTLAEAKRLFGAVQKSAAKAKNIEVVVCPPFPYLAPLTEVRNNSCQHYAVKLGAQNCFWQAGGGPYTGEVTPTMLKSVGAEYVILGHSERRRLFGETNEIINKKLLAVVKAGLKPLLFLGEAEKQEEGKSPQNWTQASACVNRQAYPPMRNILVPHLGQVPFVAGLPFLSFTLFGSFISRFALHFTQYPVGINTTSLG
jgi:triosephosphate isomerase